MIPLDINDLSKRPNESDLQYHKRLVYGKLVDKTLSDFDYQELSRYVYNQQYSTDVARRMMYGSKRTLDLLEREAIADSADHTLLNSIEERRNELYKERQKFFDQRREYNKRLAAEARNEHLETELIHAADALDSTVGKIFNNECIVDDFGDTECALVFSDWHYGMVTDNVYNSFNTEICVERVRNTVNKAVDRIKLHGCRDLHILLLGDFIHGGIHCSARVASEEFVINQLMQVSEIISQAIGHLSNYVENVYVYSTFGNHGRVIPSKNDNIHSDNMERIIGWWLSERLSKCDRITFVENSEEEFLFANLCGHYICAAHGDLDYAYSSPRLLHTLFSKKYGIDIEYIILGDKHHRESFEELGITSMICGSLCGVDEYAKDRRLFSTPSQMLLIFNEDGLDAEYRLGCC